MNLHNLTSLPVFTKSGDKLGKIHDLNIDIENHNINSYVVKANIIGTSHLIKPSQILSISKDKIVVDDATVVDFDEKKEIKLPQEPLANIAMSQEN